MPHPFLYTKSCSPSLWYDAPERGEEEGMLPVLVNVYIAVAAKNSSDGLLSIEEISSRV